MDINSINKTLNLMEAGLGGKISDAKCAVEGINAFLKNNTELQPKTKDLLLSFKAEIEKTIAAVAELQPDGNDGIKNGDSSS